MTGNQIQKVDTDNVPTVTRRLYARASLVSLAGNLLLLLGKGDETIAISLIVGGVALLAPSPIKAKAK